MREAQLPDVGAQQGHADAKNSELCQWSFNPSRSPRFRGAETPEHLLERKKEMWGLSTKMRVLNVNFDKWGLGLKTSKLSKQRAKIKSLRSDNQYVSK